MNGRLTDKLPKIFNQIGLTKHHVVKSNFMKEYTANQQKGRRISIHLQKRIETELKRLMKIGYIQQLEKFLEK